MPSSPNPDQDPSGDVLAAPSELGQGQVLKIAPGKARLSPAQQRFNTLTSRIDQLQRSQQDLDALLLRWSGPHQQAVAELEAQLDQVQQHMLLFLHERLQRPGLTRGQRQSVITLVKSLLVSLEDLDLPQVQALAGLYIDDEQRAQWQQAQEADLAEMRAMAEHLAGGAIPDLQNSQDPEAVMAALAREMQRQQQAQDARRQARQARRQPSARQQRQADQQLEARTALRTVFRQLASALHPDREIDPEARARKTELMSQANAAYERQDLASLLRLQLQVAQINPEDLARLADDRLSALCLLLKEQVAALDADLQASQWRASEALGFPVSAHSSETEVMQHLAQVRHDLDQTLAQMRADLREVQQDEGLRRWLKAQKALSRQAARLQDADLRDYF